ncbi:MAG: TIGR00730 family Rossman fold protein [Actinomycetota bacterium]
MKRVCVFCGSSAGSRPDYADSAERLGRAVAGQGLELVYGGASVGLMGVLADTVLSRGGTVRGVIPEALIAREIAHEDLTELRVVTSMHERKRVMAELADGFLALPGGMGTLEELTEILTWAQLGLHSKPFGVLNVAGYFSPWLSFLDHAVDEGFISKEHRAMLAVDDDPDALLRTLARNAASPATGT